MSGRRSTDSNASQQPAVKVVGFHVEGVPPSPASTQLLHDELQSGGGSPDPVIIPPSFQTEPIMRIPPERLNTLPTYMTDGPDSNDLREMLTGGHAGHLDASGVHMGSFSRSGLYSTVSLPPMTGSAQADLRNMALSVSKTSPPGASRARRGVRSQPTSTSVTPPVSPYRDDAERPLSNSYAPSAFDLVQRMSQRPEGPSMAATFSDGSSIPMNYAEARRVFAEAPHLLGLPESNRAQVGTPRQTTGFHIPHTAGPPAQQQHHSTHLGGEPSGGRTPGSLTPQSRAGSAASSRGSSPRTSLPPGASAFAGTASAAWTESSPESKPSTNGAESWGQAKRSSTPELPPEHKPGKPAVDKGHDRMGDAGSSKSTEDRSGGTGSKLGTDSGKADKPSVEPAKGQAKADKARVEIGKGLSKGETATVDAGKGVGKGDRAVGEAAKAAGKGDPRAGADVGKPPPPGKGDKAAKDAADKKPTTKAERRALQERQRAEKAAAKEAAEGGKQAGGKAASAPGRASSTGAAAARTGSTSEPGSSRAAPGPRDPPTPPQGTRQVHRVKPTKRGAESGMTTSSEMFAHLQQYKAVTLDSVMQESSVASKVHPAVVRLGLQYASGAVTGGNARCLAMLLTFRQVIQDYQTPESKILSRDLTAQLNLCIQFLVECRPLSISMGTAIKHLKLKVSTIDASTSQEAAKGFLQEEIDTFVQEKITFADEQVANLAQAKVASGDVVLTYAFSSAVYNTFVAAQKAGKQFRVVVVDSRPHYEGRTMLHKLLARDIPCTYLQLNALSYTMQEVTKVFLGASGAMSNGTIIARAGSAAVAMMADAMQRPVIICCETLKFHERVQLDSITSNELGDPDALAAVAGRPEIQDLQGWKENPKLELLNLIYDAMPCEYVTLIITEVGAIPPTSVPVILREYRSDPKM